MSTRDDLFLLNQALNLAVANDVLTDSQADHLEQQFLAGIDAMA